MLGKTEGKMRRGQQRMRWLHSITDFNGHEFEQTLGDSGGQRKKHFYIHEKTKLMQGIMCYKKNNNSLQHMKKTSLIGTR